MGPAATMAMRFQTLCRLNARGRSSSGDRAFALVDHLHVTTERYRGNGPLGAVGSEAARPHDAPEADGEPQHLDLAPARDAVVTKLVEDDQDAQHDEERPDFGHGVHQAAMGSFSQARATARASASAASASSVSGHRARRQPRHRLGARRRDVRETNPAGEEGRNRDLVRRVEHCRGRTAFAQARRSRVRCRKAGMIGRFER